MSSSANTLNLGPVKNFVFGKGLNFCQMRDLNKTRLQVNQSQKKCDKMKAAA